MTTYTIPEQNLTKLYAALDKLNKRAIKLGLDAIAHKELSDKFTEGGNRLVEVEVLGGIPRLNGWILAAVITPEPVEGSDVVENIVRSIPYAGIVIPEMYRFADPADCDHCHTKRKRNDVFIVYNEETGEYRQVGRNCLSDFIGNKDAQAVAAFYELLQDALEEGQEDAGEAQADGEGKYTSLRVLVAAGVSAVRYQGRYISRKVSEETGRESSLSVAYGILSTRPSPLTTEDYNEADKVIEWVRANVDSTSDYMHNVRVSFLKDYTRRTNSGFVISAVSLYNQATKQAVEKATRPVSEWIGKEGDKFTAQVKVLYSRSVPNQFSDGYRVFRLLADDKGNILSWWGSDEDFGDNFTLTGKIKKCDTYKDEKRTEVYYCKVK